MTKRAAKDAIGPGGWVQSRMAYDAGTAPTVENTLRIAWSPRGYRVESWWFRKLLATGPNRATREEAERDYDRVGRQGEKKRDALYPEHAASFRENPSKSKSRVPTHLKAARQAGRTLARMQGKAGQPGHRKMTEEMMLLRRLARRKHNPKTMGPWKTMADIRAAAAASGSFFFKNKPRRGSEYERPEKIKGPYNGRYIVVQKETKLSNGWSKSGVIYRVEDDGRFRHVDTLWGAYSWENAIEKAKGMTP